MKTQIIDLSQLPLNKSGKIKNINCDEGIKRRLLDMEKKVVEKNNSLQEKLSKLKKQSQELDIEYLSKEKQISTFLECKKTFFGKVKYFFKYSGKKNKVKEKVEKIILEKINK